MSTKFLSAATLLALAATPAAAHLDPAAHGSFAAGLSHPMFGLDHVLAMIAVGLWAVLLGGRALVAVPTAFVATMIAGFGLSLAGVSLPLMEPVIVASVVVFGLVVATAFRLPVAAGATLVAVFALFHGNAHGSELGVATPWGFLAGFAIGTMGLHAVGLAAGIGLARLDLDRVTRGVGAALALSGLGIAFAG
ncbi:MAG: HupE/UreJ family protein [Jannaschia sp.]